MLNQLVILTKLPNNSYKVGCLMIVMFCVQLFLSRLGRQEKKEEEIKERKERNQREEREAFGEGTEEN